MSKKELTATKPQTAKGKEITKSTDIEIGTKGSDITIKKEDLAPSGICIIPPSKDRPNIGLVGLGTSDEEIAHVKALSKQMYQLKMGHTIMTVEDANKEGITTVELLKAQAEQAQDKMPSRPKEFDVLGGGSYGGDGSDGSFDLRNDMSNIGLGQSNRKSNVTAKAYKRKKKGKKTHRKKR